MGVLPSALGGDVGHGALQNFQKRLLHALAGHVTGDGSVLALPGDLIHLIDVDDAPLGQLHIVVGGLDQTQQDILHVVTHIAGLCESGGVGNGEGHLQHPRQSLRKEGLAAAGGAHKQNVALLQLHILRSAEIDALVVVVYRHRQGHLGLLLADDILVQNGVYLLGCGDDVGDFPGELGSVALQEKGVLPHGRHAQAHALIADIHARTGDDPLYLILMLAAEGTPYSFFLISCHGSTSISISYRLSSTLSTRPYSMAS